MNITFEPLVPGQAMPTLVQTRDSEAGCLADVADWNADHRDQLNNEIHQAGVLLLRGFPVDSAEAFRDICASICPTLRNYTGGDSPRSGVTDKVYTSSDYAADLEVLLHNELSYAGWSPDRVFFCCLVPSQTGGETQIADGRKIYVELDQTVRSRFKEKGVTYLQHLWDEDGEPGVGKSWQETFETRDRGEAEVYLRQAGMDFEWTALGIRTAATKPAVREHAVTGELCWHNQADQWHRDMASVKDSVGDGSPETTGPGQTGQETLGNHVVFGDGSRIDVSDLEHVREVSRQCEVVFPWQQGDIMMIDNVLAMHGRKPFTGKRTVLVAMA